MIPLQCQQVITTTRASPSQKLGIMNTLELILDQLTIVNPHVVMGSEITSLDVSKAIEMRMFVAKGINSASQAHNILRSNQPVISRTDLIIVAKELAKNEEYVNSLIKRINVKKATMNQEAAARKAKLSANKAITQPVLDFVKSNGLKLGDYYKFLKSNKQFSKEFYSKKYTMTSAEAFINK